MFFILYIVFNFCVCIHALNIYNFTFLSVLSGYFTQISTLADVQENVMEYLHVLSRPKVIDREHDMVWTEAYVDNTVSDSFIFLTFFHVKIHI